MRKDILVIGGASILSFAAGVASSYFVLQKKLSAHYEEISNKEIDDAQRYFKTLGDKKFSSPSEAVEALVEDREPNDKLETDIKSYHGIVQKEQYKKSSDDVPRGLLNIIAEEAEVDVFPHLGPRNPAFPYILNEQEFFANQQELDQRQFTFYEKDQVLADENGNPIEDPDEIVGFENILKTPKRPDGEKDIIYIRNERLGSEFEVERNDNSYRELVMGETEEPDYQGDDG